MPLTVLKTTPRMRQSELKSLTSSTGSHFHSCSSSCPHSERRLSCVKIDLLDWTKGAMKIFHWIISSLLTILISQLEKWTFSRSESAISRSADWDISWKLDNAKPSWIRWFSSINITISLSSRALPWGLYCQSCSQFSTTTGLSTPMKISNCYASSNPSWIEQQLPARSSRRSVPTDSEDHLKNYQSTWSFEEEQPTASRNGGAIWSSKNDCRHY